MQKTLHQINLGLAGAIVSAFVMLLLGILGNLGLYTGAVEMMQQWHLVFSLSLGGIIGGMIEAAIVSFVFLYLFAWVYNKLTTKENTNT